MEDRNSQDVGAAWLLDLLNTLRSNRYVVFWLRGDERTYSVVERGETLIVLPGDCGSGSVRTN